jgi:membrane-bound metal-dependent hydrolase YbcI (DUF457 family)
MSAGPIHQTAGFITGIIATGINYYIYNNLDVLDPINKLFFLACIPIAVIYSLLPDMDIKSNGSVLFYFIILIITGFLFYTQQYYHACIVFACSLIPQFIPHRRLTHSLLFALIFPALPYLLFYKFNISTNYFPLVYISGVMGYFSHLVLDG